MTISNILLTGGRAPAALELARQFATAGHRVFAAESSRYHLCRVSAAVERSFSVPSPSKEPQAYIAALQAIIIECSIDMLIPTCEEVMYISQGLEQLSAYCHVFVPPLELMKQLHHKFAFIQLAQQLGFIVPATVLINSDNDWNGIRDKFNAPFILKPVYSRFASRVMLFDPLKLNRGAEWRAVTATPQGDKLAGSDAWVAQQFIAGKQLCTYSVVHNGKVTAHAAYYTTYRAGLGASIYFEPAEHAAAAEWVAKFVKYIHFTGQISFDFIEASDGTLFPIECNPRATSGVHLFDAGRQLPDSFLRPDHIVEPIVPCPEHRTMLSMAMLLFGLRQNPSWRGLKMWWRHFRQASDAVYRRDDKQPFWEQLRLLWDTRGISKRKRISLLAAATYDIEWNGDHDST
ncbi:hypothetical protein [Paenibacillus sp. GCM10027626]|uniref:hypothetical protein n=1 Tax=Paenibacillus sp. GCM10027626 TaxID=3273411 RepID=UPI00362632A8